MYVLYTWIFCNLCLTFKRHFATNGMLYPHDSFLVQLFRGCFVGDMSINKTIIIAHTDSVSEISCPPSFGELMYYWWWSSQARIDISVQQKSDLCLQSVSLWLREVCKPHHASLFVRRRKKKSPRTHRTHTQWCPFCCKLGSWLYLFLKHGEYNS